jgi:hypothetical protein
MRRFYIFIFLMTGLLLSGAADAITVASDDTGWYNSLGTHDPTNPNYAVGRQSSTAPILRDFFVFDTTPLVGVIITHAFLSAFMPEDPPADGPGYVGDAMETWTLWDVTTDLANLVNGSGGAPAYNDLGGGTEFGVATVTASANGTYVDVLLNAAGLASLQAAAVGGDDWAIGGSLDASRTGTEVAELFQWSGSIEGPEYGDARLLVNTPEPSGAILFAFGAVSLVLRRRRRV